MVDPREIQIYNLNFCLQSLNPQTSAAQWLERRPTLESLARAFVEAIKHMIFRNHG